MLLVWVSLCVLSAAAASLATWWACRRLLLQAKRVAERARNRENLLELAKLTGGLAHEIKNPLSTVKLNLQLLAEEFESLGFEPCRRSLPRLRRLQNEVQRLINILADFLKYAGQMELHPSDADLRQVVEELADFFRPQAENSRVVLRCDLPAEPVPCRVDVDLLKQAVLNLMINAAQAMPEGGELILRLGTGPGQARLEVIDTGPGIGPESLGRIFDAYFTTRPGGSGLGLPMTRRIVRQHDGDIRVDSAPGKGTSFTIRLPRGAA